MRASKAASAMIIIIGIALLWSTLATAQDRPSQYRPVMVDGNAAPAVYGVWRSRGYGYLVRIDHEGPTLFHVAGNFCYADPRPERDPDDLFAHYRPWGPDAVVFSNEPGRSRYIFDRLPGLPEACSDTGRWNPSRIAALTAATFADLYPSFAERGIDWSTRTAAALRTLDENADDDALFRTLRTMLAGVEDPHVELQAEVAGDERSFEPGEGRTLRRVRTAGNGVASAWESAYRHGIVNTVLKGKGHQAAKNRVHWGRVGDTGYLNVMSMGSLSDGLDAVLDQAIAAFAGARAVIVDVSKNTGGYDSVALQIAERFADRRRLAYTKVAFGAQGVEPEPFYIEPSKRARYLGPVYLLTSDVTMSAAEIFSLYMRALPNVVHVGGTTRGAFSDVIEKPLPNGWRLTISAEIYRDPEGQNYEARGLPPQVEREIFPPNNLTGGHARAVLALIDDIRQENNAVKIGPSNPTQ